MKNHETDLQRWSQHAELTAGAMLHEGGHDTWEKGFLSGASEQHVLNSSHLLQASPKELQTQTREKVPNSLHPFKISRETHTLPNTSQKVISQDYIFSGFFFPGLFLEDFVIHCGNNPSGKGVVWLSEKAAHCPSKLCYQCLRDLSFTHLMCEKPPVW